MSISAIGSYEFQAQDGVDRFPAPLLYVAWDEHLMFCAPHCVLAPPQLPFAEFFQSVFAAMYDQHPDFPRIDWSRVNWFKNGEFWFPRGDLSLAQNGIVHKDLIRVLTPGLSGICGSGA